MSPTIIGTASNESTAWLGIVVVIWLVFAFMGWGFGKNYGGNLKWLGFVLGLILGPIGLVILVIVGAQNRQAPDASASPSRRSDTELLADELRSLKGLKAEGLLTDEEYSVRRSKLLDD